MTQPELFVGGVVQRTAAEGPGMRFAVWTQGCSIRCAGCFNPQFWAATGGVAMGPVALAEQAAHAGVEGITLLGGEPFDQAPAAAAFAEASRKFGLSVMTFTGHDFGELPTDGASRRLVAASDLLVTGRYIADQPDRSRPWVGSTNQQFHFLSEHYAHLDLATQHDRIEVRVSSSGEVSINGWASVDQLDSLLEGTTPPVGRGDIR